MRCTGSRFELFVTDLDRAVHFYAVTLGFAATRRESDYVALSNGEVAIGLGLIAGLPSNHYFQEGWQSDIRPGRGVEIVIEVDDVNAFFTKASDGIGDSGGRIEDIADQPWGLRDFRVIDPDGYYVRITDRKSR
jgi:lactoylglutathione lyase